MGRKQKSWLLILVCLSAWQTALHAQFNTGQGINPPNNYSDEPQGQFLEEPDTSDIYYFFADNPGLEYTFSDSLLSNKFHQQDPIRRQDLDYANLGIMGSAAWPIAYQPLYRRGFDIGWHQFDLYKTPASELPFYRIEKAFTNAAYYQTGEQADSYILGQFSRNFADGINFSIDYKRISQVGSRNQFPNQRARNTALATGLWYHSPGGKYDGFFSVAWNTIEQQDNGGVLTEPGETDEGFESPSSAEVFLDNAQTHHRSRGISYAHYFTFGRPMGEEAGEAPPRLNRQRPDSIQVAPDSLSNNMDSLMSGGLTVSRPVERRNRPVSDPDRRRFTLAHRIHLQDHRYKFSDDQAADDPVARDYYGPFLVDERGIRVFVRHQEIENTFRLRTYKPREDEEDGAQRQRDLFEAGVQHRLHWLDLESSDSTVQNLFVFGRLNFTPSERLRINTYGHIGLFDQAGDYRIFGELFFAVGNLGQLEFSANNQLYSPNMLQERFVSTGREIWNNDFRKTLETNLSGAYLLPQWDFEVRASYHLLNNYIYYDTLGFARQTGTPVSVVQLIIKKDFHLGHIHLENVVTLQQSSEDFLRLPELFTKNSLYYQGKWFRVLNVQLGADLRLATTYYPNTYNPVVGQFILQDEQEVELYPAVDGYFALRITRFRAFFKFENLTRFAIPMSEQLFYQTARYPFQTGSGIRLGIQWRFVN